MRIAAWILTIYASAIITVSSPCRAFSQDRIAGIVEEIRGPAYWKKDKNAKETKLDPKLDLGRLLHVGEMVRCGRGGVLRLTLCNGRKEIQGPSVPFRITSSQECPNRRALEEYGRLGGRERGGERTPVFSPSNHSAVRPEKLVIRWIPSPAMRAFSLIIQEAGGNEIWRQNVADGASGHMVSDTARQALVKHRDEVGQGPLLLKLKDSDGNESQLTFSLLSVQSEEALEQELAPWDKGPGSLMRHLGRASIFVRYAMFTEAAEEYEAALAQAPESRYLLIRTIVAHCRTGNSARKEELRQRLPPGIKLPC